MNDISDYDLFMKMLEIIEIKQRNKIPSPSDAEREQIINVIGKIEGSLYLTQLSQKEVVMGNEYNFGDVSGSNINIDSILENVTQNIGAVNSIDNEAKKQLLELIEQLKTELQKLPQENKEDAETIADYTKSLVEASTKAQPNKKTIQITADGLKKAAENIAGVMPTVLAIATGIIKATFQFVGIPLP